MKRKALSLIVAILLVSSVVAGSAFIGYDLTPAQESEGLIIPSCEIMGIFGADCGSDEAEELNETLAHQTKIEIYKSTKNHNRSNDIIMTGLENYLQDTEAIARIKGQTAYIEALENDSTETEARIAAKEAVSDYYAMHQQNLIGAWNTTMVTYDSAYQVAKNHSDVSTNFVGLDAERLESSDWEAGVDYEGLQNVSVTLVNQSNHGIKSMYIRTYRWYPDNNNEDAVAYHNSHPSSMFISKTYDGASGTYRFYGPLIQAPSDSYDSFHLFDGQRIKEKWNQIVNQNQAIQDEMDVFVDNTFSQWESGKLNTSDFIDPHVAAAEYSPEEDFQSWVTMKSLELGIAPPDNFSRVENMNISYQSDDYSGILLSKSNGTTTFEVGTTYNTTQLDGPQFFVTSEDWFELDGEFTITAIETFDGENKTNVTYEEKDYSTADLDEFAQTMSDLTEDWKETQKRQEQLIDELENSGGWNINLGIGDPLSGLKSSANKMIVMLFVLLGVYLVVDARNNGNNGRY
jgi:hypothetical protein